MFTRVQGLLLTGFSSAAIWFVATHDDVVFRGGNFIGYGSAGLGALLGLVMLFTGENPLRRQD